MTKQHGILALLLIGASLPTYAEECKTVNERVDEGHSVFWDADTFRFDNDMLDLFGNDDQNYTYGASWTWGKCKAIHHPLYAEWATDWLSLDAFSRGKTHNFEIALTNFTPDRLDLERPIYNDRPYASLLSATSTVYGLHPSDDSISYGVSFTYGFLGLPLGEALQSTWHDVLRNTFNNKEPYHPQGWDNQIGNGGELTAKIEYSIHKKYGSFIKDDSEIVGYASANLGYYTMASVGLLWHSNAQYISHGYDAFNLANPVGAGTESSVDQEPPPAFEMNTFEYFFGLRATAMGYNALLQCQGGSTGSAVCLDEDDIERGIAEFTAGLSFPVGDKVYVVISWHARTNEHKLGGKYERDHTWGGFTLIWKD